VFPEFRSVQKFKDMDIDYDDPKELEICPYDPVYRIGWKRLSYHIAKCQKSYPEAKFKERPLNACHLIPIPEMSYHLRVCPGREMLERRLGKVDHTLKVTLECLPIIWSG